MTPAPELVRCTVFVTEESIDTGTGTYTGLLCAIFSENYCKKLSKKGLDKYKIIEYTQNKEILGLKLWKTRKFI
jgi:hypothetical protein